MGAPNYGMNAQSSYRDTYRKHEQKPCPSIVQCQYKEYFSYPTSPYRER
eukprot:NODE_5783_length_301_cov_156.317460_g5171_i0.p2 GENE.NODE_5783_length_301_cov_156.317460_g5171_i0~~NODE_5783_length_301_cov_156.317460_g5171_i0.p2  ORF type:complete len:58 (-),score=21.44 NODE_5783_length_301_cov_156.317460_g5171_i0:128-274(-)